MVKSFENAKNTTGSEGQGQRKDPAWKYGIQVSVPGDSGTGKKGYVDLECKFCRKTIKGGVKRLKNHLGGTHKNVSPCPKVPKEVKQEMLDFMKNFTDMKHMAQRNFEEMVGSGSYFGSGSGNFCSGNGLSQEEFRDQWIDFSLIWKKTKMMVLLPIKLLLRLQMRQGMKFV